jgi:cyclopropane fatty-acyl-phospholipid synthase-like methyltransferase
VVDYGCGWGGLCEALKNADVPYVGVDLSVEEIKSCQERGLNCEVGDIDTLLKQGRVADMLFAVFVFEHLVDYPSFFKKVRQVLNKDGSLVIVIPTSPLVRLLGRLHRFVKPQEDVPQYGETISPPWHTMIFSIKGVRRLAQSQGFEVVEVSPCPKYRGKTRLINFIKFWLGWAEMIGGRVFGDVWPVMTANVFVLKPRDQEG